MSKTYDEAKAKLLAALPYLRHGIAEANKEGTAQIGIISTHPNGAWRVVLEFVVDEFISDLEVVLNAPPQTAEDEAQAKAVKFLDQHGLRLGT